MYLSSITLCKLPSTSYSLSVLSGQASPLPWFVIRRTVECLKLKQYGESKGMILEFMDILKSRDFFSENVG